MQIDFLNCCAVTEVSGLSDYKTPKAALVDILRVFYDMEDKDGDGYSEGEDSFHEDTFTREVDGVKSRLPTFVVFTEAGSATARGTYGKRLAEFLEDEHLGDVSDSGPKVSSKSGNKVTVYVWTVNHKNVKKWVAKHKHDLCDCGPLGDDEDEE